MVKEQAQINVDIETHTRLKHISDVTKVPMARIISQFVEELFGLSVEYDHATLRITSSILEDTVYATLHGYGRKLSFGKVSTEQELRDVTFKKIEEDANKKAHGVDIE